MEELFAVQQDLFTKISRCFYNFKKLGASKLTIESAQKRSELLDRYYSKFLDNHDKIIYLRCKDKSLESHIYFEDDLSMKCEEAYLDNSNEISSFLKCLPSQTETKNQCSTASVQLPKISLPKFGGKYTEWRCFKDLFESLIINKSNLSSVEKLHYLKTSLVDEPQQLLQNIQINDSNFERAWGILVEKYENTKLLIHSHLSKLFAIKPASKESADELKRIYNSSIENIEALDSLGCPIKSWDIILIFLVTQNLDHQSRKDWETTPMSDDENTTFDDLRKFIQKRIRALESAGSSANSEILGKLKKTPKNSHNAINHIKRCIFCNLNNHFIGSCFKFQDQSLEKRKEFVQSKNLCKNCLGEHVFKNCMSKKLCQVCNSKHHTLLHTPENKLNTVELKPAKDAKTTHYAQGTHSVLLATASFYVYSNEGDRFLTRALIDQGSEVSFISESLVQRLNLKRKSTQISILGIAAKTSIISKGIVEIEFSPRHNTNKKYKIKSIILNKITSYLPKVNNIKKFWPVLHKLPLADDKELSKSNIDILLGADVFSMIMQKGLLKQPKGSLVAQNTIFGWIVTGKINNNSNKAKSRIALQCSTDNMYELMQKFWTEQEINSVNPPFSLAEKECEEHFQKNHERLENGRYIVRLPFAKNPNELGNSKNKAGSMLNYINKRFSSDEKFKELYTNFMEEYENLNHMELSTSMDNEGYFLPHHGVYKNNSSSTKLRVVFNGSQKTTSGISLNDILHTGPQLLPNLQDVLLKWRKHKIVFSADVEKMYRQILIHKDDRKFQKILWRPDKSGLAKSYQLNTVTYGLSCSPYLAIRTLHQLAEDEQKNYPLASIKIKQDVYMDDVLTGADHLDQALMLQKEIIQLFEKGKFNLRKWNSNHKSLLAHLPVELIESSAELSWMPSGTVSMLGLIWKSITDEFMLTVQLKELREPLIKRTVLSEIAKLFDPLGFCSPVIVRAKIFMQSLWLLGLDWDDPLPTDHATQWKNLHRDLINLSKVVIPRWIGYTSDSYNIELHGFADASEKAYGAVLYLKTKKQPNSKSVVQLIIAKSKVAPLKQITLPRLELCAALILSRLAYHVLKILEFKNISVILWTDSKVTLQWIKAHPSKWTTFVANRVSEIQSNMPQAEWRHVTSADNPADCLSRGVTAENLIKHQLWWSGPTWLKLEKSNWPENTKITEVCHLEERSYKANVVTTKLEDPEVILRFSELNRLLKVTSWIFRFTNARRNPSVLNLSKAILPDELNKTKMKLIAYIQKIYFKREISLLSKGQSIPKDSSILQLDPFLDENQVLRVGGRLKNSILNEHQKHPIITPSNSHLTWLLIKDAHSRTLHGGIQLTLSYLRRNFWIIQGRRKVKSFIHQCNVCLRFQGTTTYQKMGNLPKERVTPSRPFFHSGVDYAGPILIKAYKGRGFQCYKAYIAVFVCLSTKALHLEAVTDYTAESFLAAYRRFISRRGICATLLSDQGTNFIGASKELEKLVNNEGTQWKFIPPGAPHFGGLWEAGVKSVKYHLRRVMGETKYTFEEVSTLLCQIEACLNSRPLQPLSDDPSDLEALTPAHFLIGEPLNSLPEPSLDHIPLSKLSRFQFFQHQRNQFWKKWSNDYLPQLQARNKWHQKKPELQIGDLVLIKGENLPPSKWPLARIVSLHPGPDQLVRVVSVKTSNGVFKRPITKLVLLPRTSIPTETS